MNNNEALSRQLLQEYLSLPEYSGFSSINVETESLFGDRPINIASTRGIINEISVLIGYGVDINIKGEHGYTPLHNAAEQGHIEAIALLLKSGAKKDILNDDGLTPAELAQLLKNNQIYEFMKKFNS